MFLFQYNFWTVSSINDEIRINILISCTFFPYMNLNREISLIIYNIYNMSYNFCTGKILRIVWLYSILADERSRRWDVNYRVWNSKTPANAFSALQLLRSKFFFANEQTPSSTNENNLSTSSCQREYRYSSTSTRSIITVGTSIQYKY